MADGARTEVEPSPERTPQRSTDLQPMQPGGRQSPLSRPDSATAASSRFRMPLELPSLFRSTSRRTTPPRARPRRSSLRLSRTTLTCALAASSATSSSSSQATSRLPHMDTSDARSSPGSSPRRSSIKKQPRRRVIDVG